MYNILIADKLSPAAVDIFKSKGLKVDIKPGLSKDELLAIIKGYDGLVVRSNCKPDADIIGAADRLKVIGRAGIGVDNIDIQTATAKGVIVMNTPFGNAVTTAEHAIALMFSAVRQIPAASARTLAGEWPKKDFMGIELTGKTLGLIGCGNIGSNVASRALGLGLKVIAFDPFLTPERAIEIGVKKVELEDLLKNADIISLHTPLTDKTYNILSRETLAQTKKGVVIINCARGGLVDELALKEGLESGHIYAAALDVFTEEPAKANPLFDIPNFIATPHLGASTGEAQEKVALQVAEQMSDYLLTGAVSNALNMPSISAEEAPKLKPYYELAEKLGIFAGQIADDRFEAVEIIYEGEVNALNTKPLTAAALAGALRPFFPEVNMVSAPTLLQDRGASLTESRRDKSPIYDSLIRIRIKVDGHWRSLAGALILDKPRIVEIKDMALDAKFRPHLLYVNNVDNPGFIGALGRILGDAGVNIATFNLGRNTQGGEAIALIGVDQPVNNDIMKAIGALEHVRYVKMLSFS